MSARLTGAYCRGKLGDPARVSLTSKVCPRYRVEWEYDGHRWHSGDESDGFYSCMEPERRVRVRHFYRRDAAYRWMAMRLIFAKRDSLATGTNEKGYPSGCSLCDAMPSHHEDGPELCRYHGGDGFEELTKRLARWLRWRDEATR